MDSRTNLLKISAKIFAVAVLLILSNCVSVSDCTELSVTLTERADLDEKRDTSIPLTCFIAGVPTILAVQVATLYGLGQPWISNSGEVHLWSGDNFGPENSQHLTDWYTFDHVLHGFILHYLTGFVSSDDIQLRFLMAVTAESLWEMLENSPFIIDRYRETTLGQVYSGDSIINSLSDNAAMAVGFWMAHFLPTPITAALAVAEEFILAFNIRDNLILNILQFIAPNEVISKWQSQLLHNNTSTGQ